MSQRSQDGAGGVIAVLLAATALVALGIVGWLVFGQSHPTPWNKPAKVDGAVVQLTYTGSECQDHADVEAEEDSD